MDENHIPNTDNTGAEPTTQDKIYWHEAFYEALQLDLREYKDFLKFENEKLLSKEALKIDVLVVKKQKDVEIKKNIGKIFKGHNIFEYKSETDYLSVFDYYKVVGYALLYASFEKVYKEDVTVSFVVSKHPRELFKYLEGLGLKVDNVGNGIYYVMGDTVSVQILEQRKLSAEDGLFLRGLNSNLTIEDLGNIYDTYKSYGDSSLKNVYLARLFQANKKLFSEVENMTATLKEVILEIVDNPGWQKEIEKKWGSRNNMELAKEMLQDGEPIEKIVKYTKLSPEVVKGLLV